MFVFQSCAKTKLFYEAMKSIESGSYNYKVQIKHKYNVNKSRMHYRLIIAYWMNKVVQC